ncbi:hypothetical protein D0469_12835 [Peribacillus saganii]|uniref:YolD-like family protein n=1 Tax=Peribacillus saganii TaxID=2303992 RepID=A0A372LML7_9BACI|nr:YolD-like family protein [Peribacillus saganii]RFU68147.1 hypothetical protein D0469_12835 [Peribacillus saganii]
MILKELANKTVVTVKYYKKGLLETCTGRIYKLNLQEQTLSIQDENQRIFPILFSGIQKIETNC